MELTLEQKDKLYNILWHRIENTDCNPLCCPILALLDPEKKSETGSGSQSETEFVAESIPGFEADENHVGIYQLVERKRSVK